MIGPQEEKDGIQLLAFFAQIRSFSFKVEKATCSMQKPNSVFDSHAMRTLVIDWVFEVSSAYSKFGSPQPKVAKKE